MTPASVLEIERDQVRAFDTSHDAAVAITRIPTYGLGAWRDVTDRTDGTVGASGNGGLGFDPWIDRTHDDHGIVGVADDPRPEQAVPALAMDRAARMDGRGEPSARLAVGLSGGAGARTPAAASSPLSWCGRLAARFVPIKGSCRP